MVLLLIRLTDISGDFEDLWITVKWTRGAQCQHGLMWRFAKALLAGVAALALAASAFWLWLQHKIASIQPGYIGFTPNKPRRASSLFRF
jgi:hypothetical protein